MCGKSKQKQEQGTIPCSKKLATTITRLYSTTCAGVRATAGKGGVYGTTERHQCENQISLIPKGFQVNYHVASVSVCHRTIKENGVVINCRRFDNQA